MLGSIKGKVILKTEKYLVVEAGGVGYKINVSPAILPKTEEEVFLWVHTNVREDSIELFGFEDRSELEFFEMLLGVSGIGPRSALAVLGLSTLDTLRRAISTGDTGYLTKISGIGRKTAERIVIELKDKIAEEEGSEYLQQELDALEALKSLGYSQSEAREALKKVSPESETNTKIKEALKILGGNNK